MCSNESSHLGCNLDPLLLILTFVYFECGILFLQGFLRLTTFKTRIILRIYNFILVSNDEIVISCCVHQVHQHQHLLSKLYTNNMHMQNEPWNEKKVKLLKRNDYVHHQRINSQILFHLVSSDKNSTLKCNMHFLFYFVDT